MRVYKKHLRKRMYARYKVRRKIQALLDHTRRLSLVNEDIEEDRVSSENNNSDDFDVNSDVEPFPLEDFPVPLEEFISDAYVYTDDHPFSGTIGYKLIKWTIESNVSDRVASKLFKILKASSPDVDLPMDIRTLYRHFVDPVDDFLIQQREFIYITIARNLEELCRRFQNELVRLYVNDKPVVLNFSTDGVPVAKSSNQTVWPISMTTNLNSDFVSVIAVYWGTTKPTQDVLLSDFVRDLNAILESGFNFRLVHPTDPQKQRDITVSLKLGYITADMLAMAVFKGIKCPTGFSSCIKCNIRGCTDPDRSLVCFVPRPMDRKRTDLSFRYQTQSEHHVEGCLFTEIPPSRIHMTDNFVIDSMHSVWLGLVRRQIDYWLGDYKVQTSKRVLEITESDMQLLPPTKKPRKGKTRERAVKIASKSRQNAKRARDGAAADTESSDEYESR